MSGYYFDTCLNIKAGFLLESQVTILVVTISSKCLKMENMSNSGHTHEFDRLTLPLCLSSHLMGIGMVLVSLKIGREENNIVFFSRNKQVNPSNPNSS